MGHLSLPVLGAVFIASACAIWFAGIQLSRTTDEIDSRFGLGQALGGLILLAFATNLPEIATVSAAAVQHNFDIATGNILGGIAIQTLVPVSYTHLRAHETRHDLVCRLLLEKKKQNKP